MSLDFFFIYLRKIIVNCGNIANRNLKKTDKNQHNNSTIQGQKLIEWQSSK